MMNEPSSPPTPPSSAVPGGDGPRFCTRCGAALTAEGTCGACILQGARSSGLGRGAGAFTARSVEQMNKALPVYECQVLVGQGGMGAVYRARHKKLDRLVAIKVLRPTAAEEDSVSFAERFEREARVLAKLDHPHIVRIYDFGRAEEDEDEGKGFFYLVLEYVDGASLRDLMRDGRLTAKEALELIPQVCEALQTAHALGVIHRDIKPENILVDGEGRVRIADFGLAKLNDAEPTGFGLTQTNQTFGTLHYMAPEQMRGAGTVDHRADLYSLGVVLYEMLTGELPLGRFVAPSEKGGASKDLDGVVFRALENEPDARYQEADELKRDLVAGASVPPVLTRRQRRAQRKARATGGPSVSAARRSSTSRPSSRAAAARTPASAGIAVPPTPSSPVGATPKVTRPSLAPTDAASTEPLLRSWAIVAALVLLYGTFWIEINFNDIRTPLGGIRALGNELMLGEWNVAKARPFTMDLYGVPLWLGLVSAIAAAVLRTLMSSGRKIESWIPVALSVFGFGLMVATLIMFMAEGMLSTLRMGFALAFFTHAWAVFAELEDLRKARARMG